MPRATGRFRGLTATRMLVIAGIVSLAAIAVRSAQGEKARIIPPPSVDEPAGQSRSETAVFAGGCFWGVHGVFQHVKGVSRALSGYAGGQKNTANYRVVTQGTTGHAESVQVVFDPRQISYG